MCGACGGGWRVEGDDGGVVEADAFAEGGGCGAGGEGEGDGEGEEKEEAHVLVAEVPYPRGWWEVS